MEEFEEGRGDPPQETFSPRQIWHQWERGGCGGWWLFGAIYLPSGRALIVIPLDRPNVGRWRLGGESSVPWDLPSGGEPMVVMISSSSLVLCSKGREPQRERERDKIIVYG